MENKVWELTEENEIIFNRRFGVEHIVEGDHEEPCIEYQRAEYVEDGEYIKVFSDRFELWSIPQYGGEEDILCKKDTIDEIIDYYKGL